jgi:hypothetical protein
LDQLAVFRILVGGRFLAPVKWSLPMALPSAHTSSLPPLPHVFAQPIREHVKATVWIAGSGWIAWRLCERLFSESAFYWQSLRFGACKTTSNTLIS